MDSQKITSEKQTNNTETERFQNIINKKQEKPQRKKSGGCPVSQQFVLDRAMNDRPISVSDVLEEKVTFLSKPVNPINRSDDKKEKKEIRRLSTTDSMQEFLEIPDYIPGDNDWENDEEGT